MFSDSEEGFGVDTFNTPHKFRGVENSSIITFDHYLETLNCCEAVFPRSFFFLCP